MTVKFITMKGVSSIVATPYYVGLVQHERTMSRRETYEYCAERTGDKAAAIRAVFLALAEYIKEDQRRGNITYLDGVTSIRNYVKGAFAGRSGPWVKGVNYLSVQAVAMDPFKTLLAAILSVNNSEGAKPVINTVLDETTLVYDVITGTDVFSIADADLAPDAMKEDESVALVDAHSVETKAEIDFSDPRHVRERGVQVRRRLRRRNRDAHDPAPHRDLRDTQRQEVPRMAATNETIRGGQKPWGTSSHCFFAKQQNFGRCYLGRDKRVSPVCSRNGRFAEDGSPHLVVTRDA